MRTKSILVFLAAIAFAASPFIFPSFDGFDPNLYPNPQVDPPVQPAGYAFAIWGVIYLWLIASTGFGLLKRADNPDWDRHRWPLMISLGIGVFWLPVALISPIWATLMIFAMLGAATVALALAPKSDRWWGKAPIALYAGWLTAASYASLGLTGAGYNVAFGEVPWAYISIALALATALVIHGMRQDEPIYFASTIWALIAISVKSWGIYAGVAYLAGGGAVILTIVMIFELVRFAPGRLKNA